MKTRIKQALQRRDLGLAVRRLIIDMGKEIAKLKAERESLQMTIRSLKMRGES